MKLCLWCGNKITDKTREYCSLACEMASIYENDDLVLHNDKLKNLRYERKHRQDQDRFIYHSPYREYA